MEESNIMNLGTTTLGIVCKDGIVMAADMRATAGNLIVNKRTEKVFPVAKNMIVTMSGTVSDAQLLTRLLKAEISLKEIRNGREVNVKEGANLLAGMVYGNIRKMSMIPGISHFLLGGKDSDGFHLYDVFADGSLTLEESYVSSGSGSVFAYGVLEAMYDKNISLSEGVDLAIKAVNAALQRDTYSGNGIMVYTITRKGIEKVHTEELVMELKG
ncbi:proteasome subunit beta [Candidatus Woesearchaeota archaeon]|nr:proteasome subunit beta [Candidatus Woesearchaeota archaeon]